MEDLTIIELIKDSLEDLLHLDKYLLTEDLNERSITHRIALHLTEEFEEYDVDCEYNGDVDREGRRKRIDYISSHFEQLLNGNPISGEDLKEVSVFPDIIIHRRGSNSNNLCVIEVKKTTNHSNRAFDKIKLQAYTMNFYGNNLNYQLGVFILLNTRIQKPGYKIEFYKNGQQINF